MNRREKFLVRAFTNPQLLEDWLNGLVDEGKAVRVVSQCHRSTNEVSVIVAYHQLEGDDAEIQVETVS